MFPFMRRFRRNRRGATAMEFALIAIPVMITLFAIFDFGRYAITLHSLRTLASEAARATMINCYTQDVITRQSAASCTAAATYLPDAQRQLIAPFLYLGGLTPTVTITTSCGSPCVTGTGIMTVTAAEPNFKMLVQTYWASESGPSTSVTMPF
jgi:Flp pilus assembly protein TadG